MARWEPNARERLEKAALELFRERGFDETAVTDIAARAGLTERTFFRYFADKREVLFGGSAALRDMLTSQIAAATDTAPLGAVSVALEATAPLFEERRLFARARQAVIAAHAALQERELIKLASLGAAMSEALQRRGVPDPAATLAAEAGVAVFKVAFARWLDDPKKRDLARHIRESMRQLASVTAAPPRARREIADRVFRAAAHLSERYGPSRPETGVPW